MLDSKGLLLVELAEINTEKHITRPDPKLHISVNKDLSSLTVAGARMTIGSLILIVFTLFTRDLNLLSGIGFEAWGWTLLTSALLLGYVLTWYTALKHAPATYVATLIVPAMLITNVLSAIFITHTMTVKQVSSSLLYLAGIIAIIVFARESGHSISKLRQKPQHSSYHNT